MLKEIPQGVFRQKEEDPMETREEGRALGKTNTWHLQVTTDGQDGRNPYGLKTDVGLKCRTITPKA